MRIEKIVELLRSSRVWSEDRFGHFHSTPLETFYKKKTGEIVSLENSGSKYRLKIQKMSIRFERQEKICGKNEWLLVRSAYAKDVELIREGIKIGSRIIPF